MPMVIKEVNNQIRIIQLLQQELERIKCKQLSLLIGCLECVLFSSGSLGVMGVGIPYAIGCKLADKDKDVIVIDGDSSSLMTISDLKTISEYNIPVKIIILNNSKQGMVYIWKSYFLKKE